MILDYEHFKQSLHVKLFENNYSNLIRKIAENSQIYVGLFRPTKPKTKLIQSITQFHEIRFGDALEFIFERYFSAVGFELHEKRIYLNDKELNIDQLFSKGNILYMIEQKVRDDHDSTKKVGQFANFENKYYALTLKYPNFEIIPIMWFIDDSLIKNKNFYLQEMQKLQEDYQCISYLFYGEELFNGI
ncbi:MAG: HpyAIV family type II restriction enzyme [Bacteroidales bacterium]